jgi:hypothetical protein
VPGSSRTPVFTHSLKTSSSRARIGAALKTPPLKSTAAGWLAVADGDVVLAAARSGAVELQVRNPSSIVEGYRVEFERPPPWLSRRRWAGSAHRAGHDRGASESRDCGLPARARTQV